MGMRLCKLTVSVKPVANLIQMKRYGSDSFLIRYAVDTRAVSLHLKFLRYGRDIKSDLSPSPSS